MDCLGCCTSFKEGERLKILEGLTVQFKNYALPIKQEKSMKTLLKTIVSFLNSKGGTIYMGVEDTKGEVKGIEMFQKEKLEFSSFLRRLLQNVTPQVSMEHQALIKLQLVPVLSKLGFEDKYVPKIVIQQGDPSLYYCYVQKIALETDNDHVEHQILYGYFRHNMGGVQQCKGLNLLKEIRNKALNPITVTPTFHKNCNPEPPPIASQVCSLYLRGIKQNESKQIQQFFEDQFIKQKLMVSSAYKEEKQTVLMRFEKGDDFQVLKANLKENLNVLNLSFDKFEFEVGQEYQKQLFLQKKDKGGFPKKGPYVKQEENYPKASKKEENSHKKEENLHNKKQNCQEGKRSQYNNRHQPKHQPKHQAKHQPKHQAKHQPKKPFAKQPKTGHNFPQQRNRDDNFPKKYCVTLTNLDPSLVDQLIEAIKQIFDSKDKKIVKYVNSVQIFLKNEEIQFSFYQFIYQNREALNRFGNNQKYVIFGQNSGLIRIRNFNLAAKIKLIDYLRQAITQPCEFYEGFQAGKKHGNKSMIVCQFRNKGKACHYLDELLGSKAFREMASEKGESRMKIQLSVDRVEFDM